jgi:hypothetical protein
LNCGEKICCQFVVSGRDGPKVLNLVEEALDEIALAVEREIAVPLVLAAVRILIAPPSFLLLVAAGFLRTGSDAVDMTSVTPATDKNLRAAAIRDGLARIMHHMPRFCMLGPHAYCTRMPSIRPVWIGVRQLAVQRVWV